MPVTIGGALRHKKLYTGKQVRVLGNDADLECRGKIVDIQGDRIILELFATATYPHGKLRAQENVTVVFVVPDDATYTFSAKLVSYNDTAQLLQLEQAAPMTRTEQRSDYRLKTSKLIYVAVRKKSQNVGENWQQASLLDISRGGASILTAMKVRGGDELKVWVPLEEVDHILEAGTRVVRVTEGDDGQMTLGVSFDGLPLADQEKILDYILKVWEEKKDEDVQPA